MSSPADPPVTFGFGHGPVGEGDFLSFTAFFRKVKDRVEDMEEVRVEAPETKGIGQYD